jgi:hypothetical protein
MNHINKLLDRVDGLVKEPDLKDICITFEVWLAFSISQILLISYCSHGCLFAISGV